MKNELGDPAFPIPEGTPRSGRLVFLGKSPVLASALFVLADLIIAFLASLAAKAFLPQAQPDFVALVGLSIALVIALSVFGWWKAAGFNSPAEWRNLSLTVVPFLIVIGLPFLRGVKLSDWGTFLYLAVAYLLTGFMEEGLMRGIVLHLLKPLGITRSVVISSVLFGLLHITNFLFRSPAIVLAQIVGAFVHGIGLAAIRLRTNTIWFVLILHALHDLFLKYTNFPAIPLDVLQVTLIMLYGVYLLRTWKDGEREQS
jgi:membrane protease YdiL (CAAX protease family)